MSRFSISSLLATGFGLGYLPKAPGTWGSLATLGAYFLLSPGLSLKGELLIAFALALLGFWSAGKTARLRKCQDPSEVVIDEIAGQWLALVNQGPTLWILLSFLLFRLLDIQKPFPVRIAERLPGGLGIMADDLVAGLLANLCLTFLRSLVT